MSRLCYGELSPNQVLSVSENLSRSGFSRLHVRIALGKTNLWVHLLLPLLQRALQRLGDFPCRCMEELKQRLEERQPDLPLFATTAPSYPSSVPKTGKSDGSATAAMASSAVIK
jgi:hypothetical protein